MLKIFLGEDLMSPFFLISAIPLKPLKSPLSYAFELEMGRRVTGRNVTLYILGTLPAAILMLVLPGLLGSTPGYTVAGFVIGIWITLLYPLILSRCSES